MNIEAFKKQKAVDRKMNYPEKIADMIDGDNAYFILIAKIEPDGGIQVDGSNNGFTTEFTLAVLEGAKHMIIKRPRNNVSEN